MGRELNGWDDNGRPRIFTVSWQGERMSATFDKKFGFGMGTLAGGVSASWRETYEGVAVGALKVGETEDAEGGRGAPCGARYETPAARWLRAEEARIENRNWLAMRRTRGDTRTTD